MKQSTCSVDNCERSRVSRGYCNAHYTRVLKSGSPGSAPLDESKPRRLLDSLCAVDGCPLTACARGWCRPHYSQWQRKGEVSVLPVFTSCETCGAVFDKPSRRKRFCSDSCQQIMKKRGKRPASVACQLCGSEIALSVRRSSGRLQQSNVTLCPPCRRRSGRRHKTSREFLLARDGNRCGICSHEIDMSVAYPDKLSPSIDHIEPYSVRANNDPENLQLAHLICNVRKSNRV